MHRWLFLALICILLMTASVGANVEQRRGDLVRIGASVNVPQDMIVDGSVVVIGGTVRVDGRVAGDVVVIGGSNMINGAVGGSVVAVGGRVVLLSNARVEGDVTGIGGGIRRYPEALVQGKMNDVGIGHLNWNFANVRFHWPFWSMPFQALNMIAIIALALIAMALFPNAMGNIAHGIGAQPGNCALYGILAVLAFVPSIILLALTIIGIPLIFVFIAAMVLAWVMGYLGVALFVGSRIAGEGRVANMVEILVGVILLSLLRYVPVLGWFSGLIIGVFGLGAVLNSRFGTQRINFLR